MLNKMNISPDRQKLIVYLILIVITLVVFLQVNHYDFTNYDDNTYVTENSVIQSGITLNGFCWAFSTRSADLWNPLIWLSFMFDYQLHGLNAGGYHLTNLILHVMSALLLFWLFSRMTGTIWKSAFVASLFALHPLHVESVAWIAERKDVLSAFFWMLTLCLYVYYTEKPVISRYLLVLLSFACALMSKPMVITLPVVMILLDYWPLDRLQSRKVVTNMPEVMSVSNQGKKKNNFKKEALKKNMSPLHIRKLSESKIGGIIPIWQLREKIPFFILSVILVIITLYNPNTPNMSDMPYSKQVPFISRLANAPVAFVAYLVKTFWPHDMAVFYPFSEQIPLWQVLGASLLILVISISVIVMIKRLPYLFAGWMWFSIIIAPVVGIIQVSLTAPYAMADRYHYLPSIGLAVMLAWGIPTLIKSEAIRKKVIIPAGIIFLAVLSFISWNQCGYWKNSIKLWSHTLDVTDSNWLAYNNRGQAYRVLGNYRQAIEDCNRAIEIKPDYADAYNNRGNAYNDLSNYKQAIENYDRAIEIKPGYVDAYYNRGVVYLTHGDNISGCRDTRKACELGNCKLLEAANIKGLCH